MAKLSRCDGSRNQQSQAFAYQNGTIVDASSIESKDDSKSEPIANGPRISLGGLRFLALELRLQLYGEKRSSSRQPFANRMTKGTRVGAYGDVESADAQGECQFLLICIDIDTGKTIWQTEASRQVPKVKRHPKSSHANPTPATNGTGVVAFSEGTGSIAMTWMGNFAGVASWVSSIVVGFMIELTNGDLEVLPSSLKTWSLSSAIRRMSHS